MKEGVVLQVRAQASIKHSIVQFVNSRAKGDWPVVARHGGVISLVECPDDASCLGFGFQLELHIKESCEGMQHTVTAILEQLIVDVI
jgi:hypothetical protein